MQRCRWLLSLLSLASAGVMLTGQVAWADDDRTGEHGRATTVTQTTDRDQHGDVVSAVARAKDHDEDRDDRLDADDHGDVVSAIARGEAADEDRDEDRDERANLALADVIAALTNSTGQVSLLGKVADVDEVHLVSVPRLLSELDTADANTLSAALSANAAGISSLQSFLSTDTGPAATAVRMALANAGIDPSKVVAVLAGREDQLLIFVR